MIANINDKAYKVFTTSECAYESIAANMSVINNDIIATAIYLLF